MKQRLNASASTASPLLRVRVWFGLHQHELALYLGVSQPPVQHLETGQRRLTPTISTALLPLLLQLPSPEVRAQAATEAAAEAELPALPSLLTTTSALPAGAPTPDAKDLDLRRHECLPQAGHAQAELAQLTA